MTRLSTTDDVVTQIVRELLVRGGKDGPLTDASNLHAAGLTSQDGVEVACDLEARLGIEVPGKVNPILHGNGRRMRTLGELKAWVRAEAQARKGAKGVGHG